MNLCLHHRQSVVFFNIITIFTLINDLKINPELKQLIEWYILYISQWTEKTDNYVDSQSIVCHFKKQTQMSQFQLSCVITFVHVTGSLIKTDILTVFLVHRTND